jgi:hypothetical protein
MKKGKSIKLNLYNSIKTVYGTVDSKNLKSIYINIQSWVTPKDDYDNWNRIVSTLSREIKHSVFESNNTSIFQEKSIIDLDLRTSGISYGKKSFLNLEINLYTINEIDFKSPELKNSIKDIVNAIHTDVFKGNEYFKFYVSKKDKSVLVEA